MVLVLTDDDNVCTALSPGQEVGVVFLDRQEHDGPMLWGKRQSPGRINAMGTSTVGEFDGRG